MDETLEAAAEEPRKAVARAGGNDVRKMVLTCTVLVGAGGDEVRARRSRTYGRGLGRFARWVAGLCPERVVMESTGVYWKSVVPALQDAGVEVRVVNARHVKRVPGRKTDQSDSRWLAIPARFGLARASFVPPRSQDELRRVTRLHARLRGMASELRN